MPVADELKVILRAETAKAVREMRKAQQQTNKTEQGFTRLVTTVGKSVAGWAAAAVSVRALTRTIRESVELAGIQEEAERKLGAAIMATGKESEISAEAIGALASELQGVTTYGDEATISAAGLVQSLANLNQGQLASILPRIQDFASAMGMDLNQAANLVGKSIGSSTNALTRYGVEIDNSLEGSQRFNAILESLDDKFGGFSAAVADTASGAMVQLQNSIGDTKERLGAFLLESLEPAVRELTKFFDTLNSNTSEQQQLDELLGGENTIADLQRVNEALEKQRAILEQQGGPDTQSATGLEAKYAIEQLEIEQRRLNAARQRQQVYSDIAAQEQRGTEAKQENLEYLARMQAVEERYQDTVTQTNILRNEGLIDAETANRRLEQAASRAASELAGMEFTPQLTGTTKASATATMRAYIELAKSSLTEGGEEAGTIFYNAINQSYRSAMQGAGGPGGGFFDQIAIEAEDAAQEIKVNWSAAFSQVSSSAMSLYSTIVSMQNQATQNRIAKIGEELDALSARHERELAWAEAAGATDEELAQIKAEQLEKKQAAEEKADKKKKKLQMEQWRRQKALDITSAIQATAMAVISALGARPWGPWNFGFAAAVGAMGAAQTALIATQDPPKFERGGSFITDGPQTIMVGDGQSPRERVTVEPLSGPYRSGGGGNTVVVNVNGVIDETIAVKIKRAIERAEQRGAA